MLPAFIALNRSSTVPSKDPLRWRPKATSPQRMIGDHMAVLTTVVGETQFAPVLTTRVAPLRQLTPIALRSFGGSDGPSEV